MIRLTSAPFVSALFVLSILAIAPTTHAATIGVDNVHGFDSDAFLASGTELSSFRATITGAGHTIVPLTSFSAAALSGVDAVIIRNPYASNAHTAFTAGETTAIRALADKNAVFLDDVSIWRNDGSGADHPIGFGDNQLLLQNILSFISGGGALFLGENGGGFEIGSMNDLIAPYGASFATSTSDASGLIVDGFVPHPVTVGLQQIGVDFHLPLTVTGPAIDLTTGTGNQNVLAVFNGVPEPTSLVLFAFAGVCTVASRRRR